MAQPATSLLIFYPPQATYNWHQGASAGPFTTSITDSRIYLTAVVSGAHNYVVTDLVDLSSISTLAIDWAGTFDAAIDGNITFGISNVQADTSFLTLSHKQTTFSRTTSYLDVSSYYGSYYLKFGINVTSGFPATISSWLYNVQGFNHSYSYPLGTSQIREETAVFNGYLQNDSNTSCTCGFWVYNQSTTATNAINYTDGTLPAGHSFSKAAGSLLNSSTYYYVRTWSKGIHGFNISRNETYFLTLPDTPSGLTVSQVGPQSLNVQWTNATMGKSNANVTNQSVLIRYSASSYPTTITSGTFGANESKYDNVTISGLAEEATYYFSAWTYINASGSPERMQWSDSFVTASNATIGGLYNIMVRYENETTSGNLPIDLTKYGPHKLIVHYNDMTQYAVFSGNTVTDSTVYGFWNDIANGNFTIIANNTILYFEFTWNYTGGVNKCHRVQIPTTEVNTTFYFRTNIPLYGETTANEFHIYSAAVVNPADNLIFTADHDIDVVAGVYVYNTSSYGYWVVVPNANYSISGNQVTIYADILDANSSMGKIEYYTEIIVPGIDVMYGNLIPYTYGFKDPTGGFQNALDLDAYVDVYCFNSTGVRMTIHKEFWDAIDEVHPTLVGCKKYRIGVGRVGQVIDLLGNAPTGCVDTSDLSPEPVQIPVEEITTYPFFIVIDIDQGWRGDEINGFYVYYRDILFGTNYVNFTVWDRNGTAVYFENTTSNIKNFTYPLACKKFKYNYTLNVNHTEWSSNQTIEGAFNPGMTAITDITSFEDLISKILGNTPFKNFDTDETVTWGPAFVGIIAIILLASFGAVNAYLGMIGCGAWLCVAYGIISGLPPLIFVGGIFLISMAFVFAIGGKK